MATAIFLGLGFLAAAPILFALSIVSIILIPILLHKLVG